MYTWLTRATARQELAARLADPECVFWTVDEINRYINEALRTWNALTFGQKQSFSFTITHQRMPVWYALDQMSASPRVRTVTDTELYTSMEYHLLEPPTGGIWAGTPQFSMSDLAFAVARCRDEAIQGAFCYQTSQIVPSLPMTRSVVLDDSWLEVTRAQWVPASGVPITLVRTDDTALNYYQPDYRQTAAGDPSQYNVASLPPLVLEVDVPPAEVGVYDLLVLDSGGSLTPPTDSLIHIPDDNAWTLKWGALADLLDRESEATDRMRAQWCRQRYTEGLQLLQRTPWIMQAVINGVPADLVSVVEMDRYRPGWEMEPDYSTVVIAGTDCFTVVPDRWEMPMGVELTVLGNMPLPVRDSDYLQVSRDAWQGVIDYAQFLACFKMGGAEFTAAQQLDQGFVSMAMATNGRLEKLGLFSNLFVQEGQRQNRAQERFKNE
jgi:hypothetical protein